MKKSLTAVIALCVAILAGVAVFVFSAREQIVMVDVIRVKTNILPSTLILDASLEKIKIPQSNRTDNMVTSIEEAKSKMATSYIGKNSILYKYQIDSEISILGLKEGEVPLRISTDLIGFGGARPGDRVDIVGTKKNKDGTIASKVLLMDVRVVSHVLSSGATRTQVRNQLYGDKQVVQVNPENITTPPMEVQAMEYPVAIDLAVKPEEAMAIAQEIADGMKIRFILNPWPEWQRNVDQSKKNETSKPTSDATATPMGSPSSSPSASPDASPTSSKAATTK